MFVLDNSFYVINEHYLTFAKLDYYIFKNQAYPKVLIHLADNNKIEITNNLDILNLLNMIYENKSEIKYVIDRLVQIISDCNSSDDFLSNCKLSDDFLSLINLAA